MEDRRRTRPVLLVLALLAGCASLESPEDACDLPQGLSPPEARTLQPRSALPAAERRVLAFYYPWYGTPSGPSREWVHWNPNLPRHGVTNTPAGGYYDSKDPATVRRHIREAKEAGIDGFIASFWGADRFEDQGLEILLRAAEAEGFLITALVERAVTCTELRGSLEYLLRRRATSPAWLRAEGRPVVFLYSRALAGFGTAEIRASLEDLDVFTVADELDPGAAEPFDAVFSYNPIRDVAGYVQGLEGRIETHRREGRVFAAAVLPGYDDTVIRQPGLRVDRQEGQLYRQLWEAATEADWITITSWNEWHEGSEIEASQEYGSTYQQLTRSLADAWRREGILRLPASDMQR